MTAAPDDSLPSGTSLMWYRIEQVLGRGGFAITYLATDTHLQQRVAIKEYLPLDLARRTASGVAAKPGSEESFQWGRERFLTEAQTLARFKHPNIVRVLSFFEASNTAYLVMDFEDGRSLAQFLQANPQPDAATLMSIVEPLMKGLEELHRGGFIHRDIKPENIYLRRDGSPVLLDFGAARQALGGLTQNLTAILSPGYAPPEQYFSEKDRQGPWSDIYALAAVMYRAISGGKPPEASLRASGVINGTPDPLTPAMNIGIGRYPGYLLDAIDRALRLREKERPQSLAEWRAMMGPYRPTTTTVSGADLPAIDFVFSESLGKPAAKPGAATVPPPPPPAATAARSAPPQPNAPMPPRRPTVTAERAAEPAAESNGMRVRGWLLVAAIVAGVMAYRHLRAPAPPAQPVLAQEPAEETPPRSVPPQEELASAEPDWPSTPQVAYQERPAEQQAAPVEPSLAEQAAPASELLAEEQTASQQLDDTMAACRRDAETWCLGLMPGDGRLARCMKENLPRLSADCRPLVIERLRGGRSPERMKDARSFR